MSNDFDVMSYGAVGDGITDDATAINAAITAASAVGGTVSFPPRVFHIGSQINLRTGVALEGSGTDFSNISKGTVILAGAGYDALVMPDCGSSVACGNISISDLAVKYGDRCIVNPNTTTYITIRNVILAPVITGIYIQGSIEEWRLYNVTIEGGSSHGFHHANVFGTNNPPSNEMDKCLFEAIQISGVGGDAWHLVTHGGGNSTWINCTSVFNQGHGFYYGAPCVAATFIGCNSEGNGRAGKTTVTTGTVSAGSTSLTVASVGDFADGDPVTIKGAGVISALDTTIVSGGGTTSLVLANPAVSSVANTEVTNRSYDAYHFDNSQGDPANVSFSGCSISAGVWGRYTIHGVATDGLNVFGCTGDRPIYSFDQTHIWGGSLGWRTGNNFSVRPNRNTYIANPQTNAEQPYTVLTSPPGKDFKVYMRGSTDNGASGSWGRFEVRTADNGILIQSGAGNDYGLTLGASTTYGAVKINAPLKAQGQLFPAARMNVPQTACSIWAGTGAPNNADGSDGDIYFRSDGGQNSTIYQRRSGVWHTVA